MYDVAIRQLASGQWRWELTTKDKDKHPLYADLADRWSFPREQVAKNERTFDKAMRIELDVIADLRRSFEAKSPNAKAKV